ncbi:MAG: bifunctional folylpolyglutamate synthase/dihydrofolate synthase [Eubacteriales bacterium]|jgi:dihydrofolate synthase/folylpolyglutamate synthase|nr:bifunctional folylpolyglutamate synthase/dihydrofolate synthase [Eubacteriales bacterium]
MTYQQALDFIYSRQSLGTKLGLKNINILLERLGSPHKKLKFIHVAGTNGKGSTSAFIANVLMANGFKTGMYISPFVRCFTERIQVNNVHISKEELAMYAKRVKSVIDDTFPPTVFEVITAIGMLHFLHSDCDFVVLEVGLGGRLDATNVIPAPKVSVITSISIDHTDLLGDTIEEIAFEKCGIIKENCPVAAYPLNPPEALKVIKQKVNSCNSHLKMADINDIKIHLTDIEKTVFSYKGEKYEIHMPGVHQVYNAVTAICALELLGLDLKLKEGLANTRFAGRFEVVSKKPLIIVDGAHNYSGVTALKNSILSYFPGRRIVLVMGMLKDKEYEKAVCELAPLSSLFIATQPDNPRSLDAKELESIAKGYTKHTMSTPNRQEAVNMAKENAGDSDVIIICGSLYLFGSLEW